MVHYSRGLKKNRKNSISLSLAGSSCNINVSGTTMIDRRERIYYY